METDITMMMGSVGLMEKSMVGEDHEDENERALKRYREIISMHPKEEGWTIQESVSVRRVLDAIRGCLRINQVDSTKLQTTPERYPSVTLPKSGTTWFKPLLFSIMYRVDHYDDLVKKTNPYRIIYHLHE